MLTLSPVNFQATPPAAPPRARAEVPPEVVTDRVTLRPVAFEPEGVNGTLFETRELGRGEQVVYYDAAADAQDRERYYGDFPAKSGSMSGRQLFSHLSDLVSRTHNALDYDPEHYLYPWVDRRPGLQLDSIYSDRAPSALNGSSDPGGLWILADGPGPSSLVFSEKESKIYNCEHVVPQSWFDKKGPMRGDLHHLFTCDIDCNSLRGNSQYFEFLGRGDEKYPSCGITDHERDRFEPYGGKGAVARAVLYFILRYPGYIGDEPGEYDEKDLTLLLKWNRENPVTEYELHRNRAIEQKQGNRNPLVDFPELAERIDFRQGLGHLR